MAKPTLILQPVQSTSTAILQQFVQGKPLTSEQRNFLTLQHQHLSNPLFDSVYKYYITAAKHHDNPSFLLPADKINVQSLEQLKRRLKLFINAKLPSVSLRFTDKQFALLKGLKMHDLIFWRGNQFLSGAPFFPGGIPPVIFFQLGNYFGVAKYVILPEERAMKANILIYFEDRYERTLNQCVADYQNKLILDHKKQNNLLQQYKIEPVIYKDYLMHAPTLTLDPTKRLKTPY